MSYVKPPWAPPHAMAGGPAGDPRVFPPPFVLAYRGYDTYQPSQRPEQPKDDYWATELKENPLGLENMDVRVGTGTKENISTSSSAAHIPASSSYSRASDAYRKSYPPKASTKASLAPSKSIPNTRMPSPSRPRHSERERERERGREMTAPTARYAYPETESNAAVNGISSASQAATGTTTAHHRPPSRSHAAGRTSVPAEAGLRYSSASASAAQMEASATANRTKALPAAPPQRRHASAAIPGTGSGAHVNTHAQAQIMQRSKTLPGDALAMGVSRERERERAAAEVPRRLSDRYDYRRYPDDESDDESEEEAEEEQRDGGDAFSYNARNAKGYNTAKGQKKEGKKMDRVRNWIDNARHAVTSDRPRETRPKVESRSKSYHAGHAGHVQAEEDSYDDYEEEDDFVVLPDSAARFSREQGRQQRRQEDVVRRASAPDPMHNPPPMGMGASHGQKQNEFGIAEITEEPEDVHPYYASQERSRSHSGPRQYPAQRGSPYQRRVQERQYLEDETSSGSSSGSASDEGDYGRPSFDRRSSPRERERQYKGTPHPAMARKFTERSDSLHVDNGTGMSAVNQVQAHLPSPRSLRQSSSRTPSSRPSYEQVRNERENERERDFDRAQTSNGHLTAGQSSASAAAVAAGYGYGSPPVTPARQEYSHRGDGTRSPYAPQPVSTASAAQIIATDPAAGYHTPARLAYLYRGSGSSPSPAPHRTASSKPYTQAQPQPQPVVYSQQLQEQYGGYAAAEPKPKKRSPHASRSPSPLPPGQGQTSSSSAYYAAMGQANVQRAHSRSRGHSHAASQAVTQPPLPTAVREGRDGRQRSSSRAGVYGGYSTASGAAAAATVSSASAATTAAQAPSSGARHVRSGFWNRRGDYLTSSGHVVYCPPGRCYPRDLVSYPDSNFQDHYGRIAEGPPDKYPELPESVPRSAGRAPEKSYDSFIKYVMVGSKS